MSAKSKKTKKARVPAAVLKPPKTIAALRDNAIANLTLQGARADAVIDGAITDASVTRTIEGASTLNITVHDSVGILTTGGLLDRNRDELLDRSIVCELDGLLFDLVRVERDPPSTTLVFEDDVVAVLREFTKFRKVPRDKYTRAQFVYSMIREAKHVRKIGFYCPELLDRQPIAKAEDSKGPPTGSDDDRSPGFSPGAKITVKGEKASRDQIKVIDACLAEAQKLGAGRGVLVAVVACITQESNAGDPKYRGRGDSAGPDSRGDYQQRAPWGPLSVRMDHAGSTKLFLLGGRGGQAGWKQKHGSLKNAPANLEAAIKAVQISVGGYGQWKAEATRTVNSWLGGKGGLISSSRTKGTKQVKARYQFSRGTPGKRESSWAAMRRLADEVGWRCFAVGSTIVYASDDELLKQRPSMTVWDGGPGVDKIGWTWDRSHTAQEIKLAGRASRWGAQPGQCVEVVDQGPATGRWLVKTITRSLFSSDVDITLVRPQRDKPEPAAAVKTVAGKGSSGGSSGGSSDFKSKYPGRPVPAKVASLIERCKVISDGTPGYGWGGGHGPPLSQVKGSQRLDCSSSVSLALWRAGLFPSGTSWVSGDFAARYGKAGRGEWFTVYANAGHVFIAFHGIVGVGRFDTGGPGGGSGPKLRPEGRDTGGLTPRHFPGL